MTSRQAIVAALGTVEGLAVSDGRPAAIAAFAAWPEWRSTRFRNQVRDGARDVLWYVVVALPAGGGTSGAIDAGDPLVETVGMALADAGLGVDVVEPAWLPIEPGGQAVPVLRFSIGDR